MAQANVKTEPPTVRDLLAKAQSDKAKAHAALKKAEAADMNSLTAVGQAKRRLEDANKALADAHHQHISALAAAAADGSTVAPDDLDAAKAARTKAEEDLKLAQEARKTCIEVLEQSKENVSAAEYRCVDLAATVIADEVPGLIAEVRDLQAKLVRRKLELRWLFHRKLISYDYRGRRLLQDAIDTLNDWILPSHNQGDGNYQFKWQKVDGSARWARWRDALEEDASAQLAPIDDSHNAGETA